MRRELHVRFCEGGGVRFPSATRLIVGFEHQSDAERFLEELRERLAKFSLELHPDKTRLIPFGRRPDDDWRNGRGPKPGTFDFLGFTHSCDRKRNGGFIVLRQTMRRRLRAKLKAMKRWLRDHLHAPIPWVGAYLRRVIQGYLNYYAVPRNGPALRAFLSGLGWLWFKSLRRRSQTSRVSWSRMYPLLRTYFPTTRILHPYPEQRLAVMTRGRSPVR
jgi:RNA-directed DNA polymerase